MTVIDFSAFTARLAAASGETILPFFRTSLGVDNKSARGFDPVTEADRAAEAVMRRLIKTNFRRQEILHRRRSGLGDAERPVASGRAGVRHDAPAVHRRAV